MDARKALSTIYRVNQRFGMGYVVEVLRGANNQRIREDWLMTNCRSMALVASKVTNTG